MNVYQKTKCIGKKRDGGFTLCGMAGAAKKHVVDEGDHMMAEIDAEVLKNWGKKNNAQKSSCDTRYPQNVVSIFIRAIYDMSF